jgi:hypothetical protein
MHQAGRFFNYFWGVTLEVVREPANQQGSLMRNRSRWLDQADRKHVDLPVGELGSVPAPMARITRILSTCRAPIFNEGELDDARTELLKMWNETRLYKQIQKSRQDRRSFILRDRARCPCGTSPLAKGGLYKILKDFVINPDNLELRLPIGRSSRPERFCCLRVRSRLASRAS